MQNAIRYLQTEAAIRHSSPTHSDHRIGRFPGQSHSSLGRASPGVDGPENAAQSLLIFQSVPPLLMALLAAKPPAGGCRLHLLDFESLLGCWVPAILGHVQCCCFQLGWARFVRVAMEDEMVGYSKPELRSFTISSIQGAVGWTPTLAKFSQCFPWCFTLHTSTFASIATRSSPSLLQSSDCVGCCGITSRWERCLQWPTNTWCA